MADEVTMRLERKL